MALEAYYHSSRVEAGCDEAGRGCLAGPVYAAAVILPADWNHPLLNDSKQLVERDRDLLRIAIERDSTAWAVARATEAEIDQINILQASFLAMHRAISSLACRPESLLIDGNRFKPYPDIPHTCMVKGDSRFRSIAAASILAKTHRDAYMQQLHLEAPQYGWNKNKGYPTVAHRKAIAECGVHGSHRQSFRLLPLVTA